MSPCVKPLFYLVDEIGKVFVQACYFYLEGTFDISINDLSAEYHWFYLRRQGGVGVCRGANRIQIFWAFRFTKIRLQQRPLWSV